MKKKIYNIIFQIQGKFSYIYELNNFINYNIPTRKWNIYIFIKLNLFLNYYNIILKKNNILIEIFILFLKSWFILICKIYHIIIKKSNKYVL